MASPAPTQQEDVSIAVLAEQISSFCSQICKYLVASSLPEPTLLAQNMDFYAMAEMQMDDMSRVAPEASAMITGSPFGSDPSQSVFHQRHGTSMYPYFEQRPEKARRFARAMSCWSQGRSASRAHSFLSNFTHAPVQKRGEISDNNLTSSFSQLTDTPTSCTAFRGHLSGMEAWSTSAAGTGSPPSSLRA